MTVIRLLFEPMLASDVVAQTEKGFAEQFDKTFKKMGFVDGGRIAMNALDQIQGSLINPVHQLIKFDDDGSFLAEFNHSNVMFPGYFVHVYKKENENSEHIFGPALI